MNYKSPIHLPVTRPSTDVTPERGTATTEELKRIEAGAQQYVDQQRQAADVVTAEQMMHDEIKKKQAEMAIARELEGRDTRTTIARAATMRADGTTRLAIGIAVGVLGGALVKFLFGGDA